MTFFSDAVVAIASPCSSHHGMFGYVVGVDAGLRRLNFVWLLSMVLTPWATDLLAGDATGAPSTGGQSLRFAVYAGVLVVSYVSFLLMVLRMRSRHLLRSDTPPELTRQYVWTMGGVAAAFLLSIPLFFLTEYAWLIWAVLPPAFGLLGRLRRRRQGSGRAPAPVSPGDAEPG